MSGRTSRNKGLRGEQDIAKRIGGKRVGVAYMRNPVDVESEFANYQVRNTTQGGAAILAALELMPDGKNKYLVFKAKRGQWLCVETLGQHQLDHGEFGHKGELGEKKDI